MGKDRHVFSLSPIPQFSVFPNLFTFLVVNQFVTTIVKHAQILPILLMSHCHFSPLPTFSPQISCLLVFLKATSFDRNSPRNANL